MRNILEINERKALSEWLEALKKVLPIYIALHLAFLVLTCLAVLLLLNEGSSNALPLSTVWRSWWQWDARHYTYLATQGYTDWWRTAFFPLYPLLERGGMIFTRNPLTAGLLISNLCGLVMLVVLYRLVEEDFDSERAYRTVLYLSVFPTAFFFAAPYTESLFLCLTLLSFYFMRRGSWWLAGVFAFLTTLTRVTGFFLLLPFCYEYLRQHHFKARKIRLDILSSLLIPAAFALFALYCYSLFHDPVPFMRAEGVIWSRELHDPSYGIIRAIDAIGRADGVLSFTALRNILDLSQVLFILVPLVLIFVGPWKFPRSYWVYGVYAVVLYITLQLHPVEGDFPLQSVPRYMLELFPVFIVLAGMGKYRLFHLIYLSVSLSILFFLLVQFVTNHWIT